MLRSLVLFALCLPVLVLADGLPSSPYIEVNGHGELHVAPDLAYVNLTLEKTSMDAKAARADVEARAAKVIALARQLGIADKDIKAPAITVYPQYDWHQTSSGDGKQVLVGQHVTRSISLTLRDLSRYGALADGLFAAGVTRLDDVVPDRSDRDQLQQQALAQAVRDAHGKAEALAAAASVALGAVYRISEQEGSRGPRPMMMAAARGAGNQEPEFLSGEIEIDADVAAYYLIGH
ncbi:MAG TPA: SIMPL domain-containing protein [Gammaproteobacteria bacterium]|nr:SIMPL domain-containing protein [Gammaproteobacteria bacterium]